MRKAAVCLRALAAAAFFILAVRLSMTAQRSADISVVILEKQAISAGQAADLLEQEQQRETPQGSCFWGEFPGMQLSCKETGGTAVAAVVVTAGNPELIVPGTAALAYQENGCFLDTQTAAELFGTMKAAGQTVWYDGVSYVVYGTFESLNRMMVRQASETDGETLDMISVYLKGETSSTSPSSRSAEEFLMRCSLEGEVTDYIFLNAAVHDFLFLLPLMLAVWIIRDQLSQARGSTSRSLKTVSLLTAAVVFTAALVLVVQNFQIPADMIPTKWSDFSFWETWWKGQRKNLLLLLGTAQGEAQLALLWNLLLSVLCNVCAVFAGILFLDSQRVRREKAAD